MSDDVLLGIGLAVTVIAIIAICRILDAARGRA